jgi:hypothetical protein
MNPARLLPALALALSLATAFTYLLWDRAARDVSASVRGSNGATSDSASSPSRPDAPPPPPLAAPEAAATRALPKPNEPTTNDEAELMAELRSLGGGAPLEAVELAQRLNERFPATASAPERGAILAKSLVNLGRFYEARELAREMVARFPGNPYALDVERHLLVHPLGLPSREEQQRQAALNEK